jgi:hypothetical protein
MILSQSLVRFFSAAQPPLNIWRNVFPAFPAAICQLTGETGGRLQRKITRSISIAANQRICPQSTVLWETATPGRECWTARAKIKPKSTAAPRRPLTVCCADFCRSSSALAKYPQFEVWEL